MVETSTGVVIYLVLKWLSQQSHSLYIMDSRFKSLLSMQSDTLASDRTWDGVHFLKQKSRVLLAPCLSLSPISTCFYVHSFQTVQFENMIRRRNDLHIFLFRRCPFLVLHVSWSWILLWLSMSRAINHSHAYCCKKAIIYWFVIIRVCSSYSSLIFDLFTDSRHFSCLPSSSLSVFDFLVWILLSFFLLRLPLEMVWNVTKSISPYPGGIFFQLSVHDQ